MSKKGLFNIPIFLLVLLFPIQNIHAEGLSFKRVDSSILKNLSTFHVYTIHPPYRESLKAVSNTFFYSKVNRIAVKLYSGRVDDAHYIDRSYRIAKPAQYYLEITKENTSLLFEIENIMRIKDIKQVEGFGLRIPIRLQALVIEPRIDGKEVSRDENNALYQIRLQFEDHDTYNIESLNLNVARIPQIPPSILEIVSVSKYGKLLGRAILHKQYEAPSFLTVELLRDFGPGTTPVSVITQQRIDVTSNELTNNEYSKLSGEASYGAFPPKNVEWDGLTLKYEIHFREKQFRCELNKLTQSNFDTHCVPF